MGSEFYGTETEPSLVSLKALSFHYMPKWKEWLCLKGQGGEFPRLKELHLEGCPKLRGDLPIHLPFLERLVIESCQQLVARYPRALAICALTTGSYDISQWKKLPLLLQKLSITNSNSLESLLEEGTLHRKTSLENMRIRNCSFSRPLYRVCLPLTLKSLRIEQCKKLEFLLPEFFKCHHPSFQNLEILDGTSNLSLSIPLGNFPRVHYLDIKDLKELEFLSISNSEGDLPSLYRLCISKCPNLVSICYKNTKVASSQSLVIKDCPKLVFPIQDLPSSLM